MRILKPGLIFLFVSAGTFLLITRNAQANRPEPPGRIVLQRSLYIQNCARCHGENGKAQTKLGESLGADDLTDSGVKRMSTAKIARIVADGRGDMPEFRKKLTSKQIASIARYVRKL